VNVVEVVFHLYITRLFYRLVFIIIIYFVSIYLFIVLYRTITSDAYKEKYNITRTCERSVTRAENGAERAENRVERERSVEQGWQKTIERERSAEREVAKRERSGKRAWVTEIGWSTERLFRRSRSAHML